MSEELKNETETWFKRGVGGWRDDEEVQAYLEGLQVGVMVYLRRYRQDKAVFHANEAGQIAEEIIDELREKRNK